MEEQHHHHQDCNTPNSIRAQSPPTTGTCCNCGGPTRFPPPPVSPAFSEISPPPTYRPIRAPAIPPDPHSQRAIILSSVPQAQHVPSALKSQISDLQSPPHMASKAVATAESPVHPVEHSPSSIDRYNSTDSIAFTFDPFPTEPYSLLFLFFLNSLHFLPFYLFFLPDAHWFPQLNCWIHNSILLAGSVGVSKMAKGSRGRYRIASRQYRPTPYPLARCKRDICEEMCQKKL